MRTGVDGSMRGCRANATILPNNRDGYTSISGSYFSTREAICIHLEPYERVDVRGRVVDEERKPAEDAAVALNLFDHRGEVRASSALNRN
jgi:hypothetical protein